MGGKCLKYLWVLPLIGLSTPALAQRTDENAATEAEDGFGKSVGNEAVGIYANGEVRGFSASDAGNARIEGLYYDEQGGITDLLLTGSDIRVGLTAFGHPFPAPTGIVDSELRRVTRDEPVFTVRINSGDYLGVDVTGEAAIPVSDKFGVNAALGYFDEQYVDGASAWFISYGTVARWQPTKGTEVTALFSRYDYGDEEQGPTIYTGTGALPLKINRRTYFGQPWGEWSGHSQNIGGIVKGDFGGGWRIETGLFNSRFTQDTFSTAWFADVDASGQGERFVLSGKDQRFASTSGEFRVSRTFGDGPRNHRVLASIRGRDVDSDYGGFVLSALGQGMIGEYDPLPEPALSFGALTRDDVRQRTYSLGYEMVWPGALEINLGVSRSRYEKRVAEPGETLAVGVDKDWLWNIAIAAPISDQLTLYAAATRGIEESGTAPANVANANAVLPALKTKQWEAGASWKSPFGIRFAAAYFNLSKPYFETDTATNIYGVLGDVTHKGVEFSASGKLLPGLNLVLGAVFLDAEVSGVAVDDGRLGRRPVGRTDTLIDLTLDWKPLGQESWSFDLGALYFGEREADVLNRFQVPARLTIDLGARYKFNVAGNPVTMRAKLTNATNVYGWRVFGGGGFAYNHPRRFTISVTVDF